MLTWTIYWTTIFRNLVERLPKVLMININPFYNYGNNNSNMSVHYNYPALAGQGGHQKKLKAKVNGGKS